MSYLSDLELAAVVKLVWAADTNLYRASANVLKTDDALSVTDTLTVEGVTLPKMVWRTSSTERAYVQYTNATNVFRIDSDGTIDLAPNNTVALSLHTDGKLLIGNATDTNLYRSAADTLKTDDSFIVGANLTVSGTSAFTGTVTGLTKATVGLANVDNTSDADKPVSTAQATALALKANLASPTFTGVPAAPTAAALTNTTQVATTAFVEQVRSTLATADTTHAAATTGVHGVGAGTIVGTTLTQTLTNKTLTAPAITSPTGLVKADVGLGSVDNTSDTAKPVSTAQAAALALKADLDSPTFTGFPLAPTRSIGNSSTSIATTAFVAGTAALKADLDSPALTGLPTAPTPSAGNNTTRLATTEFVTTANTTASALKVNKAGDTMTGVLAANAGITMTAGNSITIGGDTSIYRGGADQLATNDQFLVLRSFAGPSLYIANSNAAAAGMSVVLGGTGTTILQGQVDGDTHQRFSIGIGGTLLWGLGNAATDTNLYRNGASVLKTDGQLAAGFGFAVTRASAGLLALGTNVTGDAHNRFLVAADGTLTWGSGAATGDTSLYRSAAASLFTNSRLIVSRPTGADFVLSTVGDPGDAHYRFNIDANGKFTWGTGAAAPDTNLYRSAANVLKTDDTLQTVGDVYAGGILYLGLTGDTYLYRNAAGVVRTDGSLVAGAQAETTAKLSLDGATMSYLGTHLRRYQNLVGHYSTSSATGTLKIAMPKTWSNTLCKITVSSPGTGAPGSGWEIIVNGYNATTGPQWLATSVEQRGTAPPAVRLAHDGTTCCILLGTTATVWNAPQVAVTDLLVGYLNSTGWGSGWSTSILAAETGITNIVTPTILGIDAGRSTLYAPSATSSSTTSGTNWVRAPKHTVGLFIGDTDATSGYTTSEASGNIRFNGSGVAWGDIGYYPQGTTLGQFRFSTTGAAISATPNAKVGVGSLYVADAAGITFGADVNLYRDNTNILKTDDALTVVGTATPTTITAGGTTVASVGIKMTRTSGGTVATIHQHIPSTNSPTLQTLWGGSWTGETAGTLDSTFGFYQKVVPAGQTMAFGRISLGSAGAFTSSDMIDRLTVSSGGVSVTGTFAASGAATLSSTLGVTGVATFSSYATVVSDFGIGTNVRNVVPYGMFGILNTGAGNIPQIIRGASGQSVSLFRLQDNAGTNLLDLDQLGRIVFKSDTASYIYFGAASDANLYRTAANALQTDGTLAVATPTAAGHATTKTYVDDRVGTVADMSALNAIASPAAGRRVWVIAAKCDFQYNGTEWAPYPGTFVAMLRNGSLQAAPLANAAYVPLEFFTGEFDLFGGHESVNFPTRYYGGPAGYYEMSGAVTFATNGTGQRLCAWLRNGAHMAGGAGSVVPAQATQPTIANARTTVVYLNGTTDYVELAGYQNSGGTLNTASTAATQHQVTVSAVYLGNPQETGIWI